MKVLVTAFKPFNNSLNNYSIEVLNYLNDVEKAILDVVYDECYLELTNNFNLDQFDLIIALGEARMRNEILLEVNAKNISDCRIKDNAGNLKINEIIDTNEEKEFQTLVNLDLLKDTISNSFDAGKFVCNNLYFHLLKNYPNKSLFIHIPECHNDLNNFKKFADKIKEIIQILEGVSNEKK